MESNKRRIHYSGKYPKKYNEKYKEHNPTKYASTIEKVIAKGNTPAGMHIPIMVKEILSILDIKENQIGLDCTLGYGGHTLEMLKKLNHTGHLYATDVDSNEIEKTKKRIYDAGYSKDDITIENLNFKDANLLFDNNTRCDFLLADLGISSMQLDNPNRGFSFKNDGPLDLRLDQATDIDATSLIMTLNKNDLEDIFFYNSDEPHSELIARKICEAKSFMKIDTTRKLYNIIKDALNSIRIFDKEEIKKTCQRVFQALRIEVNHELDVLKEFMSILPTIMAPNGRIAILTFHSGEDRIVKHAFKEYYNDSVFKEISETVIRPSIEEVYLNPRSKSTKLRYAFMSNNTY